VTNDRKLARSAYPPLAVRTGRAEVWSR
jgi:hypothetical protein